MWYVNKAKLILIVFLTFVFATPITTSAYVDCRDTITGCTVEQLVQIGSKTFLTIEDRVSALRTAIAKIQAQIDGLLAVKQDTTTATVSVCPSFTHDLWIGKTDAQTNGEVTKLQKFLIKEGVYPEAIVSGYYGNLTAKAVVRWQKAHGMDFVDINSGVGPLTRSKIQESCAGNVSKVSEIKWNITKANEITDANDYRSSEQSISIDVTYTNGGTQRYELGNAYGCSVDQNHSPMVLGKVDCYFALKGVTFTAFERDGLFVVTKSTSDGRGINTTKTILKI